MIYEFYSLYTIIKENISIMIFIKNIWYFENIKLIDIKDYNLWYYAIALSKSAEWQKGDPRVSIKESEWIDEFPKD